MKMNEEKIIPEIRFKEFSNNWEQCQFKDFTKLSQGLQIAISERFLEPGENKVTYITNEFLNPSSKKRYYIEHPSKNVIANVDDILMTRTGNTGKVVTNTSGAFHNNFFKIDYNKEKYSKLYLYYLLTSSKIQKEILVRAGTSTIPDLNHNDFYKIKVNIPSIVEQTKIGNLLRRLDDIIILQEQLLNDHKQLKKAMLQKMFPQKGETVPRVRFSGFTDKWKHIKLGEVCERVKGNDGRMNLPTLTISARRGWLDQRERFSANIAGNEQKNYTLLSRGELSYNHGNSKLAKYGVIFELKSYTEALVPRVYHSFRTTKNSNSNFIEYMFETKQPDRELAKLVSSGARMDGLLNISYDAFMGIKVKIPTFVEQKKIGDFFEQLDETIALHEKKLETYKELKKAMLQKIFV